MARRRNVRIEDRLLPQVVLPFIVAAVYYTVAKFIFAYVRAGRFAVAIAVGSATVLVSQYVAKRLHKS